MIIINIDKSNYKYNIIFAKKIFFIENNLIYSWEKYIFKIQENDFKIMNIYFRQEIESIEMSKRDKFIEIIEEIE